LRRWQLRTRDLGLLTEYEMHRRAAGSSQFEIGQNPRSYPLERILGVAEVASQRSAANAGQLAGWLTDDEPAVRWWAATGLVALGNDARVAEAALKSALQDSSPLVRIAAAEALCNQGHVATMLPVLAQAMKDPTPHVRLRAMAVLDRLGDQARPALAAIRSASMNQAPYPAEYLNRMIKYVSARLAK
jgi:hypothetical protein